MWTLGMWERRACFSVRAENGFTLLCCAIRINGIYFFPMKRHGSQSPVASCAPWLRGIWNSSSSSLPLHVHKARHMRVPSPGAERCLQRWGCLRWCFPNSLVVSLHYRQIKASNFGFYRNASRCKAKTFCCCLGSCPTCVRVELFGAGYWENAEAGGMGGWVRAGVSISSPGVSPLASLLATLLSFCTFVLHQ